MAERLVIDATIALKWFLKDSQEADLDKADRLYVELLAGDCELHVPDLFYQKSAAA